jgi:ferritin-like metal-binding protein YciE
VVVRAPGAPAPASASNIFICILSFTHEVPSGEKIKGGFMNDLEKLFIAELADIYDAEHQLIDTLPKMAEEAHSDEVRNAFNEHLEQTKTHARRVEDVFRLFGQEPRRKSCKGMEGIIDEGELLAKEFDYNTAKDAGLICGAQKVEHYEITSYGCLCSWVKQLGNDQALALLKETLIEEKLTDEKLTNLAERGLNLEATAHDTEKRGELASRFAKMVS